MPNRRTSPGVGQEVLEFEPICSIPSQFSSSDALEMAGQRKQRLKSFQAELKELELPQIEGWRITEFQRRVGGLFVPMSGLENSAVVDSPEGYLTQDIHRARQRVLEKHKDSDVDPSRVQQWANFHAQDIGSTTLNKYRKAALRARFFFAALCTGLEADLTYSRESIEGSELAVEGLTMYVVFARTFAGTPEVLPKVKLDEKGKERENLRRVWLRPKAVHVKQKRQDIARRYLDGLKEADHNKLFREAVFNFWCSGIFWHAVEERRIKRQQEINNQEPPRETIPLEAYANDPENYY